MVRQCMLTAQFPFFLFYAVLCLFHTFFLSLLLYVVISLSAFFISSFICVFVSGLEILANRSVEINV